LMRAKELDQALARYDIACGLAPLSASAALGRSECLLKLSRIESARIGFTETTQLLELDYLASEYKQQRCAAGLIDIFLRKGDVEHAKEVLVSFSKKIGDPDGWLSSFRIMRARLSLATGNVAVARRYLQVLIDGFRGRSFGRVYEVLADIEAHEENFVAQRAMLLEALRYRENDRDLEQRIIETARLHGEGLVPYFAYIRVLRHRRSLVGARAAAPVLVRLVERFPEFPLADGALYTAAYCYFTHIEDYHRAAELYERVAKEFPKGESCGKALWQAARCYEKLGMPRHRVDCLQRVVNQFARSTALNDWARIELVEARASLLHCADKDSLESTKE